MVQKVYPNIYLFSYTNTHHDVKDLVKYGMVKNTKTLKILRAEQNFSTK